MLVIFLLINTGNKLVRCRIWNKFFSTKALGRTAPNANEAKVIDGDVIVPMGKGGAFGPEV